MDSFTSTLRLIKSEELLGRFRSKLDLYKYLTQQMNLFLPPINQTKVAFLRAILNNNKKALRQNQINKQVVPKFQELSVKNLYNDVMGDEVVAQYLPSLEQNSGKLPDRDFFFGVLGTVKADYLRLIIDHANETRYRDGQQNEQADGIEISDEWLEELMKHPFVSKKPGKAIYLMKQRARLVREKAPHKQFQIGKRLCATNPSFGAFQVDTSNITKRKRMTDGTAQMVNMQRVTPTKSMVMNQM